MNATDKTASTKHARGDSASQAPAPRKNDSHKVTLIPGDGIGPEISAAARRVFDALGVRVEWEEMPARAEVESKGGDYLKDFVLPSIEKTRVALKGPLATEVERARAA